MNTIVQDIADGKYDDDLEAIEIAARTQRLKYERYADLTWVRDMADEINRREGEAQHTYAKRGVNIHTTIKHKLAHCTDPVIRGALQGLRELILTKCLNLDPAVAAQLCKEK